LAVRPVKHFYVFANYPGISFETLYPNVKILQSSKQKQMRDLLQSAVNIPAP
jgi:hypothetical protein